MGTEKPKINVLDLKDKSQMQAESGSVQLGSMDSFRFAHRNENLRSMSSDLNKVSKVNLIFMARLRQNRTIKF